MILDTDVLIWFLRGNEKATNAVLESMPFSISVVTYMELLQGMRNKQEMESMKKAFQSMEVNIILRLLGCHNHRPDRITLSANKTDDSISGTVYS